jgi:hypothetical protein
VLHAEKQQTCLPAKERQGRNDDFVVIYSIERKGELHSSLPSLNSGFYNLLYFNDNLSTYLTDINVSHETYVFIMSKFLLLPDTTPVERYNLLYSLLLQNPPEF